MKPKPKAKILLPRIAQQLRNPPPAPVNPPVRAPAPTYQPRNALPGPANLLVRAPAPINQPRFLPPTPVNLQAGAPAAINQPRNLPVRYVPQLPVRYFSPIPVNPPVRAPAPTNQPNLPPKQIGLTLPAAVNSQQPRAQDRRKSPAPGRLPARVHRGNSPVPPSRPEPARYSSFLGGERSPSPISPTGIIRQIPFNSTLLAGSSDSSGEGTLNGNRSDPRRLEFPRGPFRRLIREIGEDYGDFRWQPEALDTIQEVAEAYLVKYFGVANVLAMHSRRIGIGLEDFQLAINLDKFFSSKAL